MPPPLVPLPSRVAHRGMVCAADQLAASAGAGALAAGGSAADAAVAAAAVMAVTSPHTGGLGGDVLAVVVPPGERPLALLGVGRAGAGASAAAMRAEGHEVMPLRGDVRSVTVPGAVDGLLGLHRRFGRLPLERVVEPALQLAEEGFVAGALLTAASALVAGLPGAQQLCPSGPLQPSQVVRLPGVARVLSAVVRDGREGFYRGEAGQALLALGQGWFEPADFAEPLVEWAEPVRVRAWGHDLWTVPPPSQGYLTIAGAAVAEAAGLPADPDDPLWPHLLVEASRAVGHDRPALLHDGADGEALLAGERLAAAAARIVPSRAAPPDVPSDPEPAAAGGGPDGDTTHICAVDGDGFGVSLTQSNALGFGAQLVAGDTGVFLHDRGLGFSLEEGHPAELAPRRRPPHTLSPAAVTRPDGTLAHVVGTMGGDAQPQIILQVVARMLVAGEGPAAAIAGARVTLEAPAAGPFRLWHGDLVVRVEGHAPPAWAAGLSERGHQVMVLDPLTQAAGCAHAVSVGRDPDGGLVLAGGSDPRSPEGGAVGC